MCLRAGWREPRRAPPRRLAGGGKRSADQRCANGAATWHGVCKSRGVRRRCRDAFRPPQEEQHAMRLPKLVLAAAVAAVFPLVAGAQTAGVKGQGADNIETVPQSQPTSPFNQGIGGVGNQGQVGSGSIHGSRDRSSPSTSGYGASASGAGSTLPERYDPRPDTANTEGNPHTQPRGEFSQGIGGVGNEGRTGRNADTLASNTADARQLRARLHHELRGRGRSGRPLLQQEHRWRGRGAAAVGPAARAAVGWYRGRERPSRPQRQRPPEGGLCHGRRRLRRPSPAAHAARTA